MHAARGGNLNKIMLLVDKGKDVNIQDWVWVYIYTLMIRMDPQH